MTKVPPEQLKEIKDTLVLKGFKYKQSNGIHNFLNAAILQGIEVKGTDSINAFCVGDDTERIYGMDNCGNEVRTAVDIIAQILMGTEAEMMEDAKVHEGVIIPPDTPNPPEKAPDQAGLTTGVIPQYLTNELIDKHPGTIPALLSMQKTAPMYIKSREKGLKYVDVSYMTTALNLATLMDWSFEVLETKDYEMDKKHHFAVLGCLTIHTTEGKDIMKQQWGSQVLKAKMEVGDALKAAASDALKKCASMLGIAGDVYGGIYND